MNILTQLRRLLVRGLEILIIAIVIVLTLDVLWGVITRSLMNPHILSAVQAVFGEGSIYQFCKTGQAPYTEEVARVLLVWLSMFGGALAFGEKAHLGVDFFVNLLNPASRKATALVAQLIIFFMAVAVFIYGGYAVASGQITQQLSSIPLTRGMVYASMPISGLFICLFSIESIIDILRTPAEKLGAQTQSEG